MKKINVVVSGEAGIGKTTVAELIGTLLINVGFQASLVDPDSNPDETREEWFSKARSVIANSDDLEIVISVQQSARDS